MGADQWLDTTVKADGAGTFDILKPARTMGVPYASSMAYVAAGHSGFSKTSVLVVHQTQEAVTAYEIDDNGDPIIESARPFITSFWYVSCIQRDPATGDYLVSSSDVNQPRIMVVGNQAQAAIEVNLITPADGLRLRAPGSFMMEAEASEAGGSIAKLEFFQDATLIASVQSSSSYLTLIDSLPAGEYNFTAVAYDAGGRSATSKVAHVSVFNEGPIVTLLSPTNNTLLRACSSVFLNAKILAGNSEITRVEFRDGNLVLGSFNIVDHEYPVSFQVHHLDEGMHFYTVVAIDANGMAGADAATNVVATPLPIHSLAIQHYGSTLLQCFRGLPGTNYVWERSDSLRPANWQPFLTNQSATGRVHLTNNFEPAPPTRFFRTRKLD